MIRIVILLLLLPLSLLSQRISLTYYEKCDCIGIAGYYYYGNTSPDTCTWTVIQKCDTCTQPLYICDAKTYSILNGGTWGGYNGIDTCKLQGWREVLDYVVKDTVRIGLKAKDKPVTMYIRGIPTRVDSLPIYDLYLLILPVDYTLKYGKSILKGTTLIATTKRHDIYSYERTYAELSNTTRSVSYTHTLTAYNDTNQMTCLTMADTLFWGRIINDTLYWTNSDGFGGKIYRDEIFVVYKPATSTDAIYYRLNEFTKYCCNGTCAKRWYTPFTGIVYNERISVWP